MAYKIPVDCPICFNDIDFEVVFECDGAMWARDIERFCDCEIDEETMEKLQNEAIEKVCED